MDLQMFLLCLLATSVLTGLVTEGIKIVLTEHGKEYKANTLAGIVAVVLSALTSGAYCILGDKQVDEKLIVTIVALIILSWLCAMVGYDKVIQAIKQFTDKAKGETPDPLPEEPDPTPEPSPEPEPEPEPTPEPKEPDPEPKEPKEPSPEPKEPEPEPEPAPEPTPEEPDQNPGNGEEQESNGDESY